VRSFSRGQEELLWDFSSDDHLPLDDQIRAEAFVENQILNVIGTSFLTLYGQIVRASARSGARS